MNIDRRIRVVFYVVLFMLIYAISKPLALLILGGLGVAIVVLTIRDRRQQNNNSPQ